MFGRVLLVVASSLVIGAKVSDCDALVGRNSIN